MSMTEQLASYYSQASALGLNFTTANRLRRDAQRLHTISEQECNGYLYRNEEDGAVDHRGRPMPIDAVYSVSNINGPGPLHYYRTPDRETGARKRIEAIAAAIGATVEFQGDPRGWPVTIIAGNAQLSPPVRG